jgi:hypothetical protein
MVKANLEAFNIVIVCVMLLMIQTLCLKMTLGTQESKMQCIGEWTGCAQLIMKDFIRC